MIPLHKNQKSVKKQTNNNNKTNKQSNFKQIQTKLSMFSALSRNDQHLKK